MTTSTPRRLAASAALLLLTGIVQAQDIRPFHSDGCSLFPNGTHEQAELWLECCTQHDKRYWAGGTMQQRLAADHELRACVAQVKDKHLAQLMLSGVRVGGSPFYPTPFRWGYGWDYLRGYKPLSEDEKQQVLQHLPSFDFDYADRVDKE